jgi:lipopolysaccharide/colanic/teichoic acid biosynthesis glycosyltransferase
MRTRALAGRVVPAGRDGREGSCAAPRGNGGERAAALLLFLVALPVVLAFAGFVLLVDGRPAFYRGTRLGRGRKPFTMFKLRTLRRDAEGVVGGAVLRHTHRLALRGGTFLRDTRLDELPQLLNVVRGEMSFFGPRPERPEVYFAQCRSIPGYDRRFAVRPGLIGSSQLFTPHSTAKRYRTLIDNGALRRGHSLAAGAGVVAFTVWAMLQRSVERVARKLRALSRRMRTGARERRRLRRVAPLGVVARFAHESRTREWRVLDLHEECVRLECMRASAPGSEDGELDFELELAFDRGRARPALRHASCKGRVTARRRGGRGVCLVLSFRPATERSEYVLHQYCLRTSLASPRAGWRVVAPKPLAPSPAPWPPQLWPAGDGRRRGKPRAPPPDPARATRMEGSGASGAPFRLRERPWTTT